MKPSRRSQRETRPSRRPLDDEFENGGTKQTTNSSSTTTIKSNNSSPHRPHPKKKIAGGDSNTPTKTINVGSASPHRKLNSPRRKANRTTAISNPSPIIRQGVSFAAAVATNAKDINTQSFPPFQMPNNNNNNVLVPPTLDNITATDCNESTSVVGVQGTEGVVMCETAESTTTIMDNNLTINDEQMSTTPSKDAETNLCNNQDNNFERDNDMDVDMDVDSDDDSKASFDVNDINMDVLDMQRMVNDIMGMDDGDIGDNIHETAAVTDTAFDNDGSSGCQGLDPMMDS